MLDNLQMFDLDNAARNLLIVIAIVTAFVVAAWFLRATAPVASTPLPSEEACETLARIENGEEA